MPVLNLDTTNLFLGIMAAVGVLEALVLIIVSILAYRAYQRTIQTIHRLEEDQIRPLVTRVNALVNRVDGVVDEIKGMTATVTRRTEQAASVVTRPVTRAVGIARGVAAAINTLFNNRRETWSGSQTASSHRATERSEYHGG